MSQHLELSEPSPSQERPRDRALVMVIDPNPTTRSVLEVALARDGFDVWSASTGEKALELLRPGRIPDVVVLESDLGEEDGFSFVAQLRGDPATSGTPVLLLANAEDRNVAALAEVVGIDEYLQKPAFARDVVALVRLEHARRLGARALTFQAAQLPPAQLLRALLSCPRSGRLELADGRAQVSFRNGRLIEARFEGKGELDSLVRALALTRGSYRLTLEPVEGFPEVQVGVRELVLQVLPRLARWAQVQTRSLPLDSMLIVDFARLAPMLKTMPDGINGVTQLFDGYRTLQDVLVDSPFNETLTLEIATRLYLMGVVVQARGVASESEGREAPRLFEPQANEAVELMNELFAGGNELRSDEPFPTGEKDWFEEPRGTGLEVSDPAGGWTISPSPDVLAGLPAALQEQLEAFNIRVEVEPPAREPDEEGLGPFVRGEFDRSPAYSLERAVQVVTGDGGAQLAALPGDLEDRTPPLGTPAMVLEAAPAKEAPPPAHPEPSRRVEGSAGLRGMVPTSGAPQPDLESRSEAPLTLRHSQGERVSSGAGAGAGAVAVADADEALAQRFFDEETPAATPPLPRSSRKQSTSMSLWVVLGLGVVALAVVIESLMHLDHAAHAAAMAPASSAPVAPVIAPPPPPAVVAAPVVEEPPAPEAAIDVSESLLEARKFYEAGQYPKALSVLDQVLSDAPRAVDAWLLAALVRYDSNDGSGAKNAVQHVLELEPNNARVQILIASMAFDANDRDRAHAALNRYLELDPKGPHAQEAQALLKR